MAVGHWCFLSKSAVFLSVSFSERFSGAVLSVQGGCLEYCSCSKTMETEVNIHIPPPGIEDHKEVSAPSPRSATQQFCKRGLFTTP